MQRIKLTIMHSVLMTALISSAAFATTHYQKNYLAGRPAGMNSTMELTTWHHDIHHKEECNQHSHLQFTGFYSESESSGDLGKYFSPIVGKHAFRIDENEATEDKDIISEYIFHNGGSDRLSGTVSFRPRQERYGLRLDFMQDVNHPICGMFFKMNLPIVHVANSMRMSIPDDVTIDLDEPGKKASLTEFFAGNVESLDPLDEDNGSAIQKLEYAKIGGKHSAGGVADIDVSLGYKVLHDACKHFFISAGVVIPTGNRVRGERLFEPVYGNGRHVGLGGDLDAGVTIWEGCNSKVEFCGRAQYRYLFENTETRVPSLKDMPFSHYFSVGKLEAPAGTPLVPLANVIPKHFKVRPGSTFDLLADLSFHGCNFTVDVNYNMFWKDRESVWLKCNTFDDENYVIPNIDFNTSEALEEYDLAVTNELIDTKSVATPSYLTHTIGGGIGYQFNWCNRCRATVAIGGAYEFGTTNVELENYQVWGKLGLAF